jgi:hypothetical protein
MEIMNISILEWFLRLTTYEVYVFFASQDRDMKFMKTILRFIISFIFIWCMISTVRPFWDRYWLELQIEAVTIYGTKNSMGDIKD